MKKKWIIASIISVILVGCAAMGPLMSNVEHPKYTLVSEQDAIEVREYAPIIIAEVQVEGERQEAINQGFRLLADYIFGNNSVEQEVAMTAPVQQQSHQEIAMTAPVQQQAIGDAWRISFVMPSEYTMESLPKPNNDAVALKDIVSKKYAVIQFSGTSSKDNVMRHEKQLERYIAGNNINALSLPIYAFYNPPWTLPPLRRNEVMIEVE